MHALYDIELLKMLTPNQHQESSGESRIDKMRKFLSSPLMRKKPSVLQLKTFGIPLDILLQRTPSDHSIPFIITRLCQYIQRTGLTQEGLFRISGNARSVERLRASFDRSGDAPLETEGDVPSAAALLKLFLRELPDPIIPLAMHCQFLNAVKDKDKEESVACLTDLVEKLPSVNYSILNYLSSFLKQVSDLEDQNRMSASSLGIVFGPNLFRVTEDLVGLKEQSLTNQIVTYFITDYQEIFKKEDIFMCNTCFSSTSINSTSHQVAAMMSSWPDTKVCSTSVLSTWSLVGPISVQIQSADDSCLTLSSLAHSMENPITSSITSNEQEELADCSEYPLHLNDKSSYEANVTESSSLSNYMESETFMSFKTDSHLKDLMTTDEEPMLSHSVIKDSLQVVPVDSSVSFENDEAPYDKKEKLHEVETFDINKEEAYNRDFRSKDLEFHLPMTVEKSVEMLKDIHKSYPRGRRRHIKHHKKGFDVEERRSRSELRITSRLQNEDEFNGNSTNLSRDSKNELQYSSTGTLDENSSETRHSWPAFRKTREEDIALSPLPQKLEMNQSSEASVSPSAFRNYLSHRNLHLDPSLPPSPPVEQEDLVTGTSIEISPSNSKLISRKIHALKKKIKLFEELCGSQSSHTDKSTNTAMKKMLAELNKARQDLKELKEEPVIWDACETTQNKSSKGTNTRYSQGLLSVGSGNSGNMSIEDSVKEALEFLARHRKEGKRHDCLEEMSRDELVAEKVAIQKVLLNFESMHGRPSSKTHRELVRPLYDRYRCTKRLIARINANKDSAELQPILEHETMHFETSEQTKDEREVQIVVEEAKTSHIFENGGKDPKMAGLQHINFHELSLSELTDELNTVREEKRKLRKLLRDFEDQFKKEHGRKVQREDKRAMETHYSAYKNTKAKLKLLEALVAKREQNC